MKIFILIRNSVSSQNHSLISVLLKSVSNHVYDFELKVQGVLKVWKAFCCQTEEG